MGVVYSPNSSSNLNINLDEINQITQKRMTEDKERLAIQLPTAAEAKELAHKTQKEAIEAVKIAITNEIRHSASIGKLGCFFTVSMEDIPYGTQEEIAEWLKSYEYVVRVDKINMFERAEYKFTISWE